MRRMTGRSPASGMALLGLLGLCWSTPGVAQEQDAPSPPDPARPGTAQGSASASIPAGAAARSAAAPKDKAAASSSVGSSSVGSSSVGSSSATSSAAVGAEDPAGTEASREASAPADAAPGGTEDQPGAAVDAAVDAAPAAVVPASAATTKNKSAPQVDGESVPYTHHQKNLAAAVGFRTLVLPDAGFDPFSSDDVLPQLAIRLGGTIWQKERWSLAAVGDWSAGAASDAVRGQPSSLALQRFGAGIEGRYHFLNFLAGYARLSPGATYVRAALGEGDLAQQGELWNFSLEANLGAAVRLAGSADGRRREPRLHAFVEGGYAIATGGDLVLQGGPNGPPRGEDLNLGGFAPGGGLFTLGLVVSY